MNNKFSVSTFWDSRVMNKQTKESRVMLSIKLSTVIKPFNMTLKIRCTKDDYERALGGKKLTDAQKILRSELHSFVDKAENVIGRFDNPTKELFLRFYRSDIDLSVSNKIDVYAIVDEQVKQLREEGRFGSAMHLYNTANSFRAFKSKLTFDDITEKFLNDYKKYMIDNGRSVSTVGMYIRALRSLYQKCIKDGIIIVKVNPFVNVSSGWTVASKSCLYPEQVKQLWEYQPVILREQRAKDFFFFCYLCNGMNFKDVSLLKNKNIKNDMLVFIREKTKTTMQTPKTVQVYLNDEIRRVIEVYGTKSKNPEAYLFDYFNGLKDMKHHNATFVRYKRQINKHLNLIAEKLKLNSRVYLGIARHSFATRHKLDGTPTAFISEFLGHSNEKTTQHYLKSIPSHELKQLNSNLLSF